MEEIGNAAFRKYETCSEQILHVYLASQRSGKLGEGRNASLQPNRLNFWKFGWSDFRDFVLTIPILCPTYHFQWKILAKRHPVVLFTSYMTFVLPTHNQVSWGTWLIISNPQWRKNIRLDHPRLVKMIEAFQGEREIVLVMEHLAGVWAIRLWKRSW